MRPLAQVPYLTDVLQVLDVDAFGLQDLLDHIGPHLLLGLGVVGFPGGGVLLLVCDALRAFRTQVLLIHSHLKRNPQMSVGGAGFKFTNWSIISRVNNNYGHR